VHHIWCPLSSQEFQDLPDGAETTLTSAATNTACSFTILDFIPTVDRLPYLRYKKTAQAV
ncbi:hypothetical protein RAG65_28200, partial [Klebsiella pneumoniae]